MDELIYVVLYQVMKINQQKVSTATLDLKTQIELGQEWQVTTV